MKLLKRIAVLSLCVLAVSGCTKSSVTTEDLLEEMQKAPTLESETAVVEEKPIIVEEEETEGRFNWAQVAEEVEDMFHDEDFYPESVLMDYRFNEDAGSIDLGWMLKNGTTEDVALEYAVEMVKTFNDILAVQVTDVEYASPTSFGGLWKEYALNLKVGTEDGTWLVEKSYKAGEEIDLPLPEMNADGPGGPGVNMQEIEKISPADFAVETEAIYPGKK